MDFVVGILLMIIIILILYNFASISVSNNISSGSNSSNYNCSPTQYNTQFPLPSAMLSKPSYALNNKLNLNAQAYDYSKYFFV